MPLHVLQHVPARGAVEALPVDAHRGGDDDAAHGRTRERLHEHGGAEVVHADVARDRVHALPDADLGGEVDDRIDAAQRAAHGIEVADVALDELGAFAQDVGAGGAGVHLLDERVEQDDSLAPAQERTGHVSTDEACATGNEYPARHRSHPILATQVRSPGMEPRLGRAPINRTRSALLRSRSRRLWLGSIGAMSSATAAHQWPGDATGSTRRRAGGPGSRQRYRRLGSGSTSARMRAWSKASGSADQSSTHSAAAASSPARGGRSPVRHAGQEHDRDGMAARVAPGIGVDAGEAEVVRHDACLFF